MLLSSIIVSIIHFSVDIVLTENVLAMPPSLNIPLSLPQSSLVGLACLGLLPSEKNRWMDGRCGVTSW